MKLTQAQLNRLAQLTAKPAKMPAGKPLELRTRDKEYRDSLGSISVATSGMLGVIRPDKRDNSLPPNGFERKFVLTEDKLTALADDPIALARVVSQLDAPKSGRAAISRVHAAGEPMLNANPRDTVQALMKPRTPERHSKDRMVRRVIVKAGSVKAAQYNKGWNTHQWGIFSLKYSKGVVIVDHMGNESKTVFPTIGAALDAIHKIEMEVVK